jgi:hypothetical protein
MDILLKELDGKILYDRNDEKMELTGLEAIKEHSPYYKPMRTVKYDAFDYYKALEDAFDEILDEDSTITIEKFVEWWLCPKLTQEDQTLLDMIENAIKKEINCISRLYYSPITYKELNHLLLYCQDLGLDEYAERLRKFS